jgi:hypothetical protein
MEVEIQHLNDENKRLLLIVHEGKTKTKDPGLNAAKKSMGSSGKHECRRPIMT